MSQQNTSHAVVGQRVEKRASLDYFPTPPWATRALCDWLSSVEPINQQHVWEPACGEGWMARPLSEYFAKVKASDVYDYSFGMPGVDFVGITSEHDAPVDWIITNPPFTLAEEFASRGLYVARRGVALICRSNFVEGIGRYNRLFKVDPPTDILQFTERVPMLKGRVERDASTATAYAWIVWRKSEKGETKFRWLAPCRKRLERAEDYA